MVEIVAEDEVVAADVSFWDEGEGYGVEVARVGWVGEVGGDGGRAFW